jgi:TolC family type I secretion outer membrane protein
MLKKIYLMTGLAILLQAMPVHAENLSETLADAYKQNPTLQAKRAELRATDEGVAEALSGYRPTVSINGDTGVARQDSNITGNKNITPRGAELDVSQPVFRGWRTTAATNRAEYDVKAGQAELLDVEQVILLQAVTAYMDVVQNQAVVELNENNQTILARQLQATQDRFDVGELTRTDIAQAQSRLEQANAALTSARGLLASSRTRFMRIVGRFPEKPQAAEPAQNLPASRDAAIDVARRFNPRVVAAEYHERGGRELIDEVRGEELPEVSLNGSASDNWDRTSLNDNSREYTFGARLSFPFYQGGAVAARTRAAGHTASH